jgi:MscS family membrane protein
MNDVMTQFDNFWKIVLEVWNTGVFGYSIGDALVALLIILVFYGLRGLFRRVVIGAVERWAQRTKSSIGDQIPSILGGPLQFLFVALGFFFAFQYLNLEGEFETLGDNVVRSLIAFAIFWAIYNAITPLSVLLKRLESFLTREMVSWLVTGIKWGVIFLGAATILQMWGIQVGPILAGLGLFGVAVALGAQDLFRNLIGGLCVLIEKRFKVGDWIEVDSVINGTVEHIGFRSTKLRLFNLSPLYVPNQKLSDGALINYSNMTYRRIYWKISLEYRATLDQLKNIRAEIEDYLMTNGAFVTPPNASLFVRYDAFNESSIDLMLYTFTKTTVWAEWLEHKENLAYRVKEIVESNGCGFAFPSQSIYIEKTGLDTPEAFVPPSEHKAS